MGTVDKSVNTRDHSWMTIGKLIRERRKAAGHSLRALGSRVDVDPSYLSRVETDRKSVV